MCILYSTIFLLLENTTLFTLLDIFSINYLHLSFLSKISLVLHSFYARKYGIWYIVREYTEIFDANKGFIFSTSEFKEKIIIT